MFAASASALAVDLCVGVKQTAACCGAGEWPGECGRPECSGEFRGNQRTADAGADFVADYGGGRERPPVHPPLLRQREEGRQYHHSQMTDTAGVHVLAHQPVAGDRIRESGIDRRHRFGCSNNRAFAGTDSRKRRRLPSPWKRVGFERAGKEIEQAQQDFVADRLRDVVLARAGDCGGQTGREWSVALHGRTRTFRDGRIGHLGLPNYIEPKALRRLVA